MPYYSLYLLVLHIRLSSTTYSSQLVDIFSYELPLISLKHKHPSLLVVYNFHNLLTHSRYLLFTLNFNQLKNNFFLKSIADLFPSAGWLEREVSELYGISFENKKDTRNLMLQYGDVSTPFQKHFPTIGLKEFYYDTISDLIIQTQLTTQI